ncbi:MAG: 2-amino-4-hydroxy-6-hydroxymethyldihydropteridine diphosphokinase [Roseobacter sp.]|nr:2-amino-4-hydroxy-6-hydroxymethyldihydropteridine diphosphokinase [Roseobacter sp.]
MPQAAIHANTGKSLPKIRSFALIAVGSNTTLGEVLPAETIALVVEVLSGRAGVIRGQSGLYSTPAFPEGSGPDFVNAALLLETDLAPDALLAVLHEIEADFGRERHVRWGPRTLDLDLVGYENQVLPDTATYRHWASLTLEEQMRTVPEDLILPHPRLHERGFVLVPLADVAPDWRHPVLGLTVVEMLQALPKTATEEVRAL